MADIARDLADDGAEDSVEETVERVVADVLDDIEHGRVQGETATLLKERLQQAGIRLRDEAIESLADDIEEDASR